MKAADIQYALTRQYYGIFPYRINVCVPNVSWGWQLKYEADLIVISKARVCSEVEIKVSKADFNVDAKKDKWVHYGLDPRISKFYYAVPEDLVEHVMQNSKPEYGVISVSQHERSGLPRAKVVRKAKNIKGSRKPSEEELQKILHLGNMRYWSLFEKEGLRKYGEAEAKALQQKLESGENI